MKVTALALGMLAATEAASLAKPRHSPPLLKLRGGLGGIDADQVATVAAVLTGTNGAVMSLAPELAGEKYGVAETKMTTFFAQWSGLVMLSQALAVYLALGGATLAEGLAWGMVPITVASVQDFLNDRMVGKLGMSAAAKYMPTLVNMLFMLGLFGKLSFMDAETTMKVVSVWMGANGLAGYFATDAWMEGWGGKVSGVAETGMAKFMASCMMGGAMLSGASVFMGKSALESWGLGTAVYFATAIDGNYISKTTPEMGVDPNKSLFWLAVQAATMAAIFF